MLLIRNILAIFIGKLLYLIEKLLGKNATTFPGKIASKVSPEILSFFSKRTDVVIVITGTNGKTSVNNLVFEAVKQHVLSERKYANKGKFSKLKLDSLVVCNNFGSNMENGIITAFLKSFIFPFRRFKYAIFEVDEASSCKIFEKMKPNILLITNLFRDQLDRYGEIDSIRKKLESAVKIAKHSKLVLNADDQLVSSISASESEVFYYGLIFQQEDLKKDEIVSLEDEVTDGSFCVKCGEKIFYKTRHYAHLGNFICGRCGYSRAKLNFSALISNDNESLKFDIEGLSMNSKFGLFDVYNILSAFSLLRVLGIQKKDISTSFKMASRQIGRMQRFDLGKEVIFNLSKNPSGFNQALAVLKKDERKKDIVVVVNDKVNDGRDISWIWDVNFEELFNESLNLLIASGGRKYDLALRFKYSERTANYVLSDVKRALHICLENKESKVLYVLVNYSALLHVESLLKLIEKQKKNVNLV